MANAMNKLQRGDLWDQLRESEVATRPLVLPHLTDEQQRYLNLLRLDRADCEGFRRNAVCYEEHYLHTAARASPCVASLMRQLASQERAKAEALEAAAVRLDELIEAAMAGED